MHTRRDFLRNAAVLTGSAFVWGSVPEAIARAFAIDPDRNTTFLDAEHVVILMQENRSFDHCFGALSGVRGYRDPRAHIQPSGAPVWFQSDAHGETFAPLRLDIKETNVTWIGGLPHSWPDQIDARNGGRYNQWLVAKHRDDLPLTLGYYTREDIPFYYSLADAFTVCDQAFCSSLTGTTPNRLFLWTGTIRRDANDTARVMNGDTDYGAEASWPTFPERLEEAGVEWKVYQNEISLDTGLTGEEDGWLSSFTDNPLEWFTQYHVRFSKSRRKYVQKRLAEIPAEIQKLESSPASTEEEKAKVSKQVGELRALQTELTAERAQYNDATWQQLSKREQSLHERAFTTNSDDPNFRTIEHLKYDDNGTERTATIPSGDILHQFRKDVTTGQLPAVSWIVAPEHFSDHPSSAWFGAWYVSECLNILTKDPEVWKKTIFILCYDENDGYFDHVPPFVASHPNRPETGKTSDGLDTTVDVSNAHDRDSSIGLGFRCPLVVASPWSRGGAVNSEVCDHTSVIQLIETWLAAKGKPVHETNISDWRRTVCGDLSSVFKPFHGEAINLPKPLGFETTIENIDRAKYRKAPSKGAALSDDAVAKGLSKDIQEKGTRPSSPLPYELDVNGQWSGGKLTLTFEAHNRKFGRKAKGAAFNVYSYGKALECQSYTVKAGSSVQGSFLMASGTKIRVDGPNGFMRQYDGDHEATPGKISAQAVGEQLEIKIQNLGANTLEIIVHDESYGATDLHQSVKPNGDTKILWSAKHTQGWYDFTVNAGTLRYRFAGRIETGKWSITDPAMA